MQDKIYLCFQTLNLVQSAIWAIKRSTILAFSVAYNDPSNGLTLQICIAFEIGSPKVLK